MRSGSTSAGDRGAIPAAGRFPRRLSSLIGRERELAEICSRLGQTRLLTLTGAGGSGKTTLAIETAKRLAAEYSGGSFWVELAALSDPAAVPRALALALGVVPLPGQSELDAALGFLDSRQALVVLDNCEHLIDECAAVAEALLRDTTGPVLLATSRAPLAIKPEAEWQVPPLSLPPAGAPPGATDDSEAVALFAERARQVSSRFTMNPENAAAVAEICSRLDGMPLAIELAAARIRMLSPEQIAAGLDDALGLVGPGPRTAEPRQRTLRASIEWSHNLLTHAQQRLLRRLSVFAGGFTLPLAEAVCADAAGHDNVLDLLGGLVEQSLVQVVESQDAPPRYRLLETVRQRAAEWLEEAGEAQCTRDRHRDALLEFAERQSESMLSPRQPEVLATLESEASNLLAAIEHAIATDSEKAQRLVVALASWFRYAGRLREGAEAIQGALDAGDAQASSLRANALTSRSMIARDAGEFERALALAEEAREMAAELGDERAAGHAMFMIADAGSFLDIGTVRPTIERGLEFGQRTGNDWLVARSVLQLATLDWFQQARRPGDDPFAGHWGLLERLGDRETLSYAHFVIGGACYATLEEEIARARFAEAIAIAREIGHPLAEDGPRGMTALFDVATGRPEDARQALREIRERLLRRGGLYYLPWIELNTGISEAACGRLEAAAQRLSEVVSGRYGTTAAPLAWAEAELANVLELLGDDAAAQAHAQHGIEAAEELGNPWNAAQCRLTLGELAASRKDWSAAQSYHHEALTAIADRGLRIELPRALEGLARVAAGLESNREAARLLVAADRARRERGPVAWPAQAERVNALTERVRTGLGAEGFEAAREEGAALGDEEVIGWVRRGRGERKRPATGWESLTPTELEVARHVAEGLTNPQIAERMFVSRSTVKTHLAHIYAKLEVSNRVELANAALRRDR